MIVFLDPACRKPYSHSTLAEEAMGGSEATCVRIAERIALLGNKVAVLQHCRDAEVQSPNGVIYAGFDKLDKLNPEHIITLRDVRPMAYAFDKFPRAKQYLWLHDLVNPTDLLFTAKDLFKQFLYKPKILCVSQSHLDHVKSTFLGLDKDAYEYVELGYVYNAIEDDLKPDATLRDINKMVLFSSPHKGIRQSLALFRYVRRSLPELKLYVANPGYEPTHKSEDAGVVTLGKLKHSEIVQHVREAMCVFYPQHDWAARETFGLVFAEANAVGTPVIAHSMGSAREILGGTQAFDTRDPKQVLGMVERYQAGDIKISNSVEHLRTGKVVDRWLNTLLK